MCEILGILGKTLKVHKIIFVNARFWARPEHEQENLFFHKFLQHNFKRKITSEKKVN